jgi:hypothetical protein
MSDLTDRRADDLDVVLTIRDASGEVLWTLDRRGRLSPASTPRCGPRSDRTAQSASGASSPHRGAEGQPRGQQ